MEHYSFYYCSLDLVEWDFYNMLMNIEKQVTISLSTAMFHQFEKNIRQFLYDQSSDWYVEKPKNSKVWSLKMEDIVVFLKKISNNCEFEFYCEKILEMHIFTNVFKHGDGKSLELLKEKFPHYLVAENHLMGDEDCPIDYANHENLKISEDQFSLFSHYISKFWLWFPIVSFCSQITPLPKWIDTAAVKDV